MGRLGQPPLPCFGAADAAATGLPGLRTWRGVYLAVAFTFLLWVALLTALTKYFSP